MKTFFLTIILGLSVLLSGTLFAQKKSNLEGIRIGEIAPEIILPTVKCEEFYLSQKRGKVILIDFWASWCAPCRKKMPELLEVYDKFKSTNFDGGENGFEIVLVSLDRDYNSWKTGIKKDGTQGLINVGDMKGWGCEGAKNYNISRIPSYVLLDGEGKVIAINLSPKELNRKLKRMKQTSWFGF